jgi:methyl-accepting chemotaxis protein PixJ
MTQAGKINKLNILQGFSKLGLKSKATILAIAIGTIPVVVIGTIAYFAASPPIRQQVANTQKAQAQEISDKLNRFLFERYGDIQILSNLPILRNSKVRAITTPKEKQSILDGFISTYKAYDSIAVFDLAGNPIVQSSGTNLDNHSDRVYFQEALKTGKPVISQAEKSKSSGKIVMHFAAPIRDSVTGEIVAIVRSRMPLENVEEVIENFGGGEDTYHIFDAKGSIIMATEKDRVGRNALEDIPGLREIKEQGKLASFITHDISNGGNVEQLGAFSRLLPFQDMPELKWSNAYLVETENAFRAERQLAITIAIGTGVVALLVALLATWLANKAIKPIEEAAIAVEKIGKGQLDTRLEVAGEDELAVLGNNINLMTSQLGVLQKEREQEVQRIETARQEARADADASAQEQKTAKEKLQSRALELLIEVDPISRGDLTIRAKVTDDEIGTLADSYNSTVQSLRQIVVQVQATAQQVVDTTDLNEPLVQSLSQEALRQSEEIAIALARIQEMSSSIQAVASNAQKVEDLVQQASVTLHAGDIATNRTVDGISTIRTTVSETSDKLKHLGESTKNISRVVKLISSFAEQTNLLALNASFEAARAGVQGLGFAVVVDEIQSLAQQSAEATTEITDLVAEIQIGTSEVVLAMQAGTKQVDIGTKLVEESRLNLTQISAASVQISSLVGAIAQAAVTQTQTSESVTKTMNKVAAIADTSSDEAIHVVDGFKQILILAKQLQSKVERFKVS